MASAFDQPILSSFFDSKVILSAFTIYINMRKFKTRKRKNRGKTPFFVP